MKNLNEAIFGTLLFVALLLGAQVLYFAPWFFPSIQDPIVCSDGEIC